MKREVESSSGLQQSDWHALTWQECVESQESESQRGLSDKSVRDRQRLHGSNSIPMQGGPHAIVRFLRQFHQPLLYILLASAIITAVMDEWVDASVIFGVLLINAIIGYLQESKAAKALEALVRTTSTEARVIRAGVSRVIPSSQLVPGDVVLLQSGEKVPADLRLIVSRELQVDESSLTGESYPASKIDGPLPPTTPLADRSNMAYASTLVTYGQGTGVVIATGANTEVGRISELISSADALETPLTKKIGRFSRWLLVVILILAAVTFAVGWWRDQPMSELFMATVALAVGAIPEGLPAAVTITLAIGVARMARRRSIVRKLPAVETLGSTTVICSDKTGTLTVNQMTVREIWAGGQVYNVSGTGYEIQGDLHAREPVQTGSESNDALDECLRAGLFCNDSKLAKRASSWQIEGDPTEGALISVAAKSGLDPNQAGDPESRMDVIPFESQHQYMATMHRIESVRSKHVTRPDGESIGVQVYVKGAAEVLLQRCTRVLNANGETTPVDDSTVRLQVDRMAAQGLRVLAFAGKSPHPLTDRIQRQDLGGLTLLGLQGMIDPPRPEAVQAIEACQHAGIRIKVITGDHPLTTHAIARQLGITEGGKAGQTVGELAAITSQDLEACDDQQLVEIADRVTVFARATPELKLRLVRALQANGNVVAMTGDGVNDAPALKQADIGVAMGVGGTEVAKEAADMVLTDDNFASIEAAVEEGRGVFDNLTKYIVWTLPTSMGEGLVVLAAIFAGVPLPILPVQILWINMTTAVLLGLMLAFEPKEQDIMSRPPRDPAAPILTPELIGRILLVSIVMLVGAFGSFRWAIDRGLGEEVARTIAANVFVFVELFYLFNCRSLTRSMFQQGLFSNRWIGVGVTGMVVLQLGFTYLPPMNTIFRTAPIDLDAWWRILLTGFATYALVGFEKLARSQIQRRKSRRAQ